MSKQAKESGGLRFLYRTLPGRLLLRLLTARWVSKAAGAFLDSRLSKPLIRRFVEKAGIDLSQFEADGFTCFNDCFCRRIKEGRRPFPSDPTVLAAPCDGLLSAYRVQEDTVLPVKQSAYTLSSLLKDEALAARYRGGTCLVFRLCVDHYHRYSYPTDGVKGDNVFIPGRLHTVRPIALESRPVFVENCREYTLIDTPHHGTVVQMEVGAMLVGRIVNHHGAGPVARGQEKGLFQYGGSTIILLLPADAPRVAQRYFDATQRGEETPVQLGDNLEA
ncbi:MAG: phosphatidylserine decarboxylase [Ruminococcaceae bacterium]|nr:phosphatidylserine decarboxylase [Oscillospiraceae bacterium]